jgi:hypothetical protein
MTDDFKLDQRVASRQRRREDREVCPLHDLIQSGTKEHRESILKQLGLKADKEIVETHLKSVTRTIGILITVGCLVIGAIMGTAFLWIRSDMDKSDNLMLSSMATIHRRITENANVRVNNDDLQMEKLNKIENRLDTAIYRLEQMERVHSTNSNTNKNP